MTCSKTDCDRESLPGCDLCWKCLREWGEEFKEKIRRLDHRIQDIQISDEGLKNLRKA